MGYPSAVPVAAALWRALPRAREIRREGRTDSLSVSYYGVF